MNAPRQGRRRVGAEVLPDPATQGWFRAALHAAWVGARRLLSRRSAPALLVPGEQGGQLACIAGAAAPGWYMLEVCVASERTLVEAQVELRCGPEPEVTERRRFPLYSKRLCKRLVLVRAKQSVCLSFDAHAGELTLEACRLVPVTAGFARSRMVRRLGALHPLYRHDPARAAGPLARLWHDYGALFEAARDLVPYDAWLEKFGGISAGERARIQARLAALARSPRFSIVVIVSDADSQALAASVEALERQSYPHWQLIVARLDAGGLADALGRAVAAAQGDWIQFLQAGDLLDADALSILAADLAERPQCSLAYTDEDTVDASGARRDPHFKPDWDIDLVRSRNVVGASAIYRLSLVRAAGPFSQDKDGAQLFDLLLRCAERVDAGAVRHMARVLLHRAAGRTVDEAAGGAGANSAGVRALCEHFRRQGIEVAVTREDAGYRVRYPVPGPAPLVTLVIPTRNGLGLLRRCIDSILDKTSYPNYDLIVVDNGSDDPATLDYLERLAAQGSARVLREDGPFNYSALNNSAVAQARGALVGLLNNDLEVINPDWLSEMVGQALRPDVGAVGARLWYADDTLQHAGVILGMEGTAGHLHRFLPRGQGGYQGRAAVTQSFSAVTGACLLVRRQTYVQAGGLNEADLPVACNDIDFCLRLRELGYRNIWTPYAELYHHESSSRGLDDSGEKARRAARENAYLQRRWGTLLGADPAYNPNLSLDFTDVVLAWPPRHHAADAGVHPGLS